MNRLKHPLITSLAIILLIVFAWAGSYLALRTWKGEPNFLPQVHRAPIADSLHHFTESSSEYNVGLRLFLIDGYAQKKINITVPYKYQKFTSAFQPLIVMDKRITGKTVAFKVVGFNAEDESFNFTIGTQF